MPLSMRVDSVLIDEARTPLIISGQSGKSTKLYEACDIFVKQLTRGTAKRTLKDGFHYE